MPRVSDYRGRIRRFTKCPWIVVDIITLGMERVGQPLRKFHYLVPTHARGEAQ
jgi:hypothetical protein